jgi:hypothetical protein
MRRYGGHWIKVVRAGVRFLEAGGASRVPRSYAHGHDRPEPGASSKPDVIARALVVGRRFYELAEGDWPTEWEYHMWGAAERDLARRTGSPLPIIPTAKPIRSTFGNYLLAVRFAADWEHSNARLVRLGPARSSDR